MAVLFLKMPTEKDLPEVAKFKQEFFAAGERIINGGALLDRLELLDWLDLVHRNNKPETVPENWVVSSTFLAKRESDERIVGIIDLRHSLDTEFLADYGGHIGYAVRPSERRKGYAKEMLTQVIDYACEIGIKELKLGCCAENLASIGVIRACGGFLREEKPYIDQKPMLVFCINTAK